MGEQLLEASDEAMKSFEDDMAGKTAAPEGAPEVEMHTSEDDISKAVEDFTLRDSVKVNSDPGTPFGFQTPEAQKAAEAAAAAAEPGDELEKQFKLTVDPSQVPDAAKSELHTSTENHHSDAVNTHADPALPFGLHETEEPEDTAAQAEEEPAKQLADR